MLIKVATLKGYALHGLDGEFGKVKEFYFDDQYWTIRYLIADTGTWLTSRQVLISPHALVAVIEEKQQITINLTKKQIEDSPSLDSDKPVSRQFEATYYGYYGYPMYWAGAYMWGASCYPRNMPDAGLGLGSSQGLGASTTDLPNAAAARGCAQDEDTCDSHLRSTHDVSGHHIHAADGEIGHVEDFVIDDETWAICYLVVDTRNWWPGKQVLLSPRWISRISWSEQTVFVHLPRETIKQAPEYTKDSLLSRDYESRLHEYYNYQGYWKEADEQRP